jgi:hypothetical protein
MRDTGWMHAASTSLPECGNFLWLKQATIPVRTFLNQVFEHASVSESLNGKLLLLWSQNPLVEDLGPKTWAESAPSMRL